MKSQVFKEDREREVGRPKKYFTPLSQIHVVAPINAAIAFDDFCARMNMSRTEGFIYLVTSVAQDPILQAHLQEAELEKKVAEMKTKAALLEQELANTRAKHAAQAAMEEAERKKAKHAYAAFSLLYEAYQAHGRIEMPTQLIEKSYGIHLDIEKANKHFREIPQLGINVVKYLNIHGTGKRCRFEDTILERETRVEL